jgi:hypothetical protein
MLGKVKLFEFSEKAATDTGLTEMIDESVKVRKSLDLAARKQEEFPEDEQSNINLEIAEANLDAIVYAGEQIVKENHLGFRDSPKLQEQIEWTKEKRAYNTMYSEAKQLYLSGSFDELRMMMETVKEAFEDAELAYITAKNDKTANNQATVDKLGIAFDKALTQYNASLSVQFDVDSLK